MYDSDDFSKEFLKSSFPCYALQIKEILNIVFSREGKGMTTFEKMLLRVSEQNDLGTPFPEFATKISHSSNNTFAIE